MFRKDELSEFVGKFYYEGARRKRYLVRFGVLTILSAVIAAYGVLDNSTATVIGAMIIAPLMMPIMAMATALVMGRLDRAFRSFLTVSIGAVAVVFVSYFIADTYFGFISLETNSEITSRVAPNITALFIALASGAVAAFAMSRDDINDSLPGAAIAIALVPPLAVVGICLSVGNISMAGGAFILFLTNFLSIIVAGSLVLHLLGLSKFVTKKLDGKALKRTFLTIGIGLLVVIIPLVLTSKKTVNTATIQNESQDIVENWLIGSEYKLNSLDVNTDKFDIVISGEGEVPNFDDLVNNLEELVRDEIVVHLNAVQSKYFEHFEQSNNTKDNLTN